MANSTYFSLSRNVTGRDFQTRYTACVCVFVATSCWRRFYALWSSWSSIYDFYLSFYIVLHVLRSF